ncbi:MAG: NTP transferase domain-containing protein [Candidatus Omnitrophica bacterium]|nr:NTP transferase domain-containing protein [Candidatus Omnitrophota bacterium]
MADRHAVRGVILAGGLGKRLAPLTRVTNKHLLPIYNRPMIFYPIETLVKAGIRDILIVTGGTSSGDFLRLMGNGRDFGLEHITYAYQEGEGGIAAALSIAENFARGEKLVVILGDNIVEDTIAPYVEDFRRQPRGAKILLKEVDDPGRFGVVTFEGDRIVEIQEKPRVPASRFAVTGIYMYDGEVFDIVRDLKPSGRGELEITDVNTAYLRMGCLTFDILKGFWSDAGTFDSLLRANTLIAERVHGQPARVEP